MFVCPAFVLLLSVQLLSVDERQDLSRFDQIFENKQVRRVDFRNEEGPYLVPVNDSSDFSDIAWSIRANPPPTNTKIPF